MRKWLVRNREGVNTVEEGESCHYDKSGWFFIHPAEGRRVVFATWQPYLVREIKTPE